MSNKKEGLGNSPFDLDYQFSLYLQRVDLDPEKMPEMQLTELKRAFMGACGQMLILFIEDIPSLEDKNAQKQFAGMVDQCKAYWITEMATHDPASKHKPFSKN